MSSVGGTRVHVWRSCMFSISVINALLHPGCFIASAIFFGRGVADLGANRAYLKLGLCILVLALVCIGCILGTGAAAADYWTLTFSFDVIRQIVMIMVVWYNIMNYISCCWRWQRNTENAGDLFIVIHLNMRQSCSLPSFQKWSLIQRHKMLILVFEGMTFFIEYSMSWYVDLSRWWKQTSVTFVLVVVA